MAAVPNETPVPVVDSTTDDLTCVIVLGMAGSGKTTLVQQLAATLYQSPVPPYVINLDPACIEVPYPVNIDIRDTVSYKEVMRKHELGPNGGIITSLNLFATRFDQVLKLLDSKRKDHKYVIIDTPGQIEVFTWSASGTIITETLAASHPTLIVFVMDISKSENPITFMSNMLYACSILYKSKLPFLIAFNKVDIVNCDFAMQWMKDTDAFEATLEDHKSYLSCFSRSLSLVLDKFYENIATVGVSGGTGAGIPDLLVKIDAAAAEYRTEYLPNLQRIQKKAHEMRDQIARNVPSTAPFVASEVRDSEEEDISDNDGASRLNRIAEEDEE